MLTVSINRKCKPRRFFHPKQQSVTANVASGNKEFVRRRSLAEAEEVVTVTDVCVVPGGVKVEGEKPHDAPAGSPEQANETAEANPPCGAIEMVAAPLLPAVTVMDTGAAATAKSGGRLMVYVALANALLSTPGATATAFSVSVDEMVIEPLYKAELVVGADPLVVK